MTIVEIAYMVLETMRSHHLVDDDRIDIRLVMDWIDLKRGKYIKDQRAKNPNSRLNLNLYQSIELGVFVDNVFDAGHYPYVNDTTQIYKIVESDTIPAIIEDAGGPMILSIESEDLMKLPFSVVDFDYMKFAGNGKFNRNLIFTSVRDNKVYFRYNQFFDSHDIVIIRAVFESPREVPGYDIDKSRYPANHGLIEYIKNGIYDLELKTMLELGRTDEVNDATGEVK
jgi:hypothetical protein